MQMLSIIQSGYDEGVIHITALFLNVLMIIVSCLERHSAAARVKSERVGATIRKNKNSMCANPLKQHVTHVCATSPQSGNIVMG